MTCHVFGLFTEKKNVKSSDYRELFLEGAIFIVGNQNLPQMFHKDVYDYHMFYVSIKCI